MVGEVPEFTSGGGYFFTLGATENETESTKIIYRLSFSRALYFEYFGKGYIHEMKYSLIFDDFCHIYGVLP